VDAATNRRQLLASLTAEGIQLVDSLIVDHIQNSERFLQYLDADERSRLNAILQKLLLAHGDTPA
jgi:DNA-binding MarR family transcriptional regulator